MISYGKLYYLLEIEPLNSTSGRLIGKNLLLLLKLFMVVHINCLL